ncbi:hypothetical protein GCM10020295_42610 [Streptomyces cinereospinus]
MAGPGQHDADRGEDRGPRKPEPGSGARRARVGGRHGGVIIALGDSRPYGRSATFRSTRKIPFCTGLPGPARPACHRSSPTWHTPAPTYTVRHLQNIPPYGRHHVDSALTHSYAR